MRLILAALCLTALPAFSEDGNGRDARSKSQTTAKSALPPFVAANITETLYHELAHALIDVIDLPIYGYEEDAADVFAIVLMNKLHDADQVSEMALHVARNYRHFADLAGTDAGNLDLWDVHSTDLERYYNLACLMFGADPERRADLPALHDLPDERTEFCEVDYAQAERAWGAVLARLGETAPGDSIHLDWTVKGHEALTEYVSQEIDRLNQSIVFPRRINVSVIPCGEANAFYDPDYVEIQICTELGDSLVQMAER